MFEVRSFSPFDNDWQHRDTLIDAAAGRTSDAAGAGFGQRDHYWEVESFEEAQELKNRLERIDGVTVTVREA